MSIISKIKTLLGIKQTKYYYVYYKHMQEDSDVTAYLRTVLHTDGKHFPFTWFIKKMSQDLNVDPRDLVVVFWAEISKEEYDAYDDLPIRKYETQR